MDLSYWRNYFKANSSHFQDIKWRLDDQLTEREKEIVTSSLQQFKKGEQSEGKHFFSFAKTFPDPCYLETIKLFIREEQTHAFVLGKFMDLNRIPRIKNHWVDNVFRWLRKLTNLENTVTVLMTAEIIAKVYYGALSEATGSALLKEICSQILRDEDQHIVFQSYTLSLFYERKTRFHKFFNRLWHQILMMGTIVVVWFGHRKVLKAANHSLCSFFMQTMLVFLESEKLIQNKNRLKPAFKM